MENIRYWIFKIPGWEEMLVNENKLLFQFYQKREFSGTKGDMAVLLDVNRTDFFFSSVFLIEDVKIKEGLFENNEIQNDHLIEFELVEKFNEKKPLEYYLYSIKRVRNWERPSNHFKLKYTEINHLEYEAITKDKVFIERTILGGVLNELPAEHRESFMELLMAEMPSVFFEINDYTKVFELLKKYLEFAIINPSKMLSKSYSTMKEILPDQNLNDLAFGEVDDDYKVSYESRVKDQVDLINENLSSFVEFLEMGTSTKTQEEKLLKNFNDLFKRTNLSHLIKRS